MLASTIFILLISLLLAIQTFAFPWTKPLKIKIGHEYPIQRAFYVDQRTGVHHLFWKEHVWQADRVLHYVRFLVNSTILDERQFPTPMMNESTMGKIQGNGDDLYLMLMPKRVCGWNRAEKLMCGEPAFSQSHDGGDTWSKFTGIPRDNLTDACSREAHSFIFLPKTQRLIFVYAVSCLTGEPDRLAMVTKSPGAVSFSRERIIFTPEGKKLHHYPVSEFTEGITGARGRLHVFWVEPGSQDSGPLMYFSSDDYGMTWTAPRALRAGVVADRIYEPLQLTVTDPKLTPGTITLAYLEGSKTLSLLVSKDYGTNFVVRPLSQRRVGTSQAVYGTTDVKICGTAEQPVMVVLTETDNAHMEYFSVDLKTVKTENRYAPAYYYKGGCGVSLACNMTRENKVVVTALHFAGVPRSAWISQELLNKIE